MSDKTLYATLEAIKEIADDGYLTAAEIARLERVRGK
jgi:hypothetical protein